MGVLIHIPKDNLQLTGEEKVNHHLSLQSKQLSATQETVIEIPVAHDLNIPAKDIYKYITVDLGSEVTEGEVLAKKSGFLRKATVTAPQSGEVRRIDHSEGVVAIATKAAAPHTFTLQGIWKGIEDTNAVIELKEGMGVAVSHPLPHSISGKAAYCETEAMIDDDIVTNAVVTTPLSTSVAISRLCAFDPIALVTQKVVYYSQTVPQLMLKNKEDLEHVLKKAYPHFLYIAESHTAYWYKGEE